MSYQYRHIVRDIQPQQGGHDHIQTITERNQGNHPNRNQDDDEITDKGTLRAIRPRGITDVIGDNERNDEKDEQDGNDRGSGNGNPDSHHNNLINITNMDKYRCNRNISPNICR